MFDKRVIEKLRQDLRFRDPGIFEKTVYALNLLPPLLKVYPDLVFKGGTSLLFHQYPPVRLSIDVDILLPEREKLSLKDKLAGVAESSGIFKAVEEDLRREHIPKAHFKFSYDSHFSSIEQSVLLDVVFCESPYPKLIKKPLNGHVLILQDTDAVVTIPTAEGLFGDKLTAIAPKTLGLKLTEGRDMEFLKQVVDLGGLFALISSIADIKQAFWNAIEQENGFRGSRFTQDEIVGDIMDVAWKYSQWMVKGADSSFKETASINRGLDRIRNHLLGSVDSAALKVTFAKIVHVLRMLREEEHGEIIKDIKDIAVARIQDLRFEGKYKILEGLKKGNRQAFSYWALAVGTNH